MLKFNSPIVILPVRRMQNPASQTGMSCIISRTCVRETERHVSPHYLA